MTFDAPLPWAELQAKISGLTVVPTGAGSAEISTWPKQIRAVSLFSARTNSAHYLGAMRQILEDYTQGKINLATAQLRAQEWLEQLGYSPKTGFAGEAPTPPANTWLQNLASDQRIKLVVETLGRHALATGMAEHHNSPNLRHTYPCWEFLRLYFRKHPRGEGESAVDLGWPERWVRCGGELADGERMIARKDDEIWEKLGDSDTWSDAMDTDVPPFAFNSGFGWIARNRATCVELGVIDEDDDVEARAHYLTERMFDQPGAVTLADVKAKKNDLIAALAMLKEAA